MTANTVNLKVFSKYLMLNQRIVDLYSTLKSTGVSQDNHVGYFPQTKDLGGYFKEYAPSEEQNLREYLKITITAVL